MSSWGRPRSAPTGCGSVAIFATLALVGASSAYAALTVWGLL